MATILKTPEKLILRIPANESLANAIRRSVAEVPTLAIEDIEMYKNDSALYDEIVAHRIGLIPIKTEKSMSSKTKIDFKLSKVGPCTVYSGDLEGSADLVFDKIPITVLGDGHKLELVATAILGLGINHAKFIPGLCYYRHILNVKSSPEVDAIIQKSKFGAIKPEKKGSSWLCDLNEAEASAIVKIDEKAITDSNEILFIIESYGNMPAQDIFTKAIEALEDNLKEFEKAIK
ncbi:MAG: DNA-directed RNA polymerase subunit D [Nanoarchaeota archaeon]